MYLLKTCENCLQLAVTAGIVGIFTIHEVKVYAFEHQVQAASEFLKLFLPIIKREKSLCEIMFFLLTYYCRTGRK